jgi:predicted RNase H-like HicB family nuclease
MMGLLGTFMTQVNSMKLKIIVHEAEEGGYWAEVPAISGCATQGETFEDLPEEFI